MNQRQRSQEKLKILCEEHRLLLEKLTFLRKEFAITASAVNKFELGKQIDQAEAEIQQVEQQIQELENKVQSLWNDSSPLSAHEEKSNRGVQVQKSDKSSTCLSDINHASKFQVESVAEIKELEKKLRRTQELIDAKKKNKHFIELGIEEYNLTNFILAAKYREQVETLDQEIALLEEQKEKLLKKIQIQ